MKILWVKTELLHPVDKGGKIRTYNMLKELKRDHHIVYLTLDDGTAAADARARATEYCDELVTVQHHPRKKFTAGFYAELATNLLSPLPYATKKYVSRELRAKIKTLSVDADVVVCDFLAPAGNVPFDLTASTLLFQHNVEAMIWKRHYEVESNPLKKAFLYGQWKKMRAFECKMCRQFDSVVAVSKEDRDRMKTEYAVKNVFDVPTGVDVDFFRPANSASITSNNLVFTGSMDWLPNEDAIRYFTEQVMPAIKAAVPEVTLTVVGRNPYSTLLELAKHDRSVIVTGRVDDVRPYMEQAAVYVVPIRVGGGTRLKIYEAMAMEKAIVSTTVGAEGLPLSDGKELLLADTPEAFATAVIKLLRDHSTAAELGKRAAKLVRDEFGWPSVAQRFAEICEEAMTTNRRLARPVKPNCHLRVEQVQET